MLRPSRRARWVAVLLILVFPLVHGQGMAADLGPLLKAFFESVDPPARQTAIAAILRRGSGPAGRRAGAPTGTELSGRRRQGMADLHAHRLRRQGSALPRLRREMFDLDRPIQGFTEIGRRASTLG